MVLGLGEDCYYLDRKEKESSSKKRKTGGSEFICLVTRTCDLQADTAENWHHIKEFHSSRSFHLRLHIGLKEN